MLKKYIFRIYKQKDDISLTSTLTVSLFGFIVWKELVTEPDASVSYLPSPCFLAMLRDKLDVFVAGITVPSVLFILIAAMPYCIQ